MAIAARKAFIETVQPDLASPPRLADAQDVGGANPVHHQQQALEAHFTRRHAHPRFRAAAFSLLTLASLGLWAAIIAAAIHVGGMVHP